MIGDSEMVPPLAKTSIKVVVCANKQTKPVKIDSLMPLSVLNVPPTIPNTHSPGHHTSHKTRRPASRTNSGDVSKIKKNKINSIIYFYFFFISYLFLHWNHCKKKLIIMKRD